MKPHELEHLLDTLDYFIVDDDTRLRREKATVKRRGEIAEAKRKKELADMELVQIPGGMGWMYAHELRKLQQNCSEDEERSKLEKHTRTNGVSGHGDYGIVHDPCVVHLMKYEKVAMWLWQEGSDWEC